MTSLTVVVDNQAGAPDLAAEWGLALWVEHQGQALLYDTGQGQALLPNLRTLGLDPARLAAVVISHGHFDHIGGLAALLGARREPLDVWCHPGVFDAHLKQENERLKDIGAPLGGRALYEDRGARFRFVARPVQPWPGVSLLAPIPRLASHEGPGAGLTTLLGSVPMPDPIGEDLALGLDTPAGLVVLTGCAHAGVVNTLSFARKVLGRPAAWLAGGLHLEGLEPHLLEPTMAHLEGLPGLRVAAGHCTGASAAQELSRRLAGRFQTLGAGLRLEF